MSLGAQSLPSRKRTYCPAIFFLSPGQLTYLYVRRLRLGVLLDGQAWRNVQRTRLDCWALRSLTARDGAPCEHDGKKQPRASIGLFNAWSWPKQLHSVVGAVPPRRMREVQ